MTASISSLARRSFLSAAGAFGLAGCSGLGVLNAIAGSGHRRQEGVGYGADPRQRLDVYLPDAIVAATPLVVFFYGGSWTRGERADYGFVGESLASAGVAVLVADYRLSPAVRWQQILADCAAATRWAFDQAPALGLGRDKLHVMGHSAGGYNAAMLALDPRWLAGVGLAPRQLAGWVGLAGPYDFLPIVNPEARVAFDWPATPADSQPIAHAGEGRSRALLLAPAEDTVVNPLRSTLGLARRLEAAGTPVRHRLLDHVGHGTIVGALAPPLRALAPVREEVLAFLRNEPLPAVA